MEEHRVTARILDILEYLAASDEHGATLTELAAAMHAPKSSLFPILHTMEARRYLHVDHQLKRYTVGLRAYLLSSQISGQQNQMKLIESLMKALTRKCQETSQMAILDGRDVLYISKEDSSQTIRMISKVGKRLPANATAVGKALLSGLSDEEVRRRFASGLDQLTEYTISSMELLLQQLAEIRRGGVATETQESTLQLKCWAVPLRADGTVFAAISVSMPLFRYDEERERQVIAALRKAQQEIESVAQARDFLLNV